jgi:hypothetical protein
VKYTGKLAGIVAASGFVALESVQLANLTTAGQAFGKSRACSLCVKSWSNEIKAWFPILTLVLQVKLAGSWV